jgi:flavin-dependent dehydrogenase
MAKSHSGNAVDVLVIGGGPAGATAAALLASWGRSVVVIHRQPRDWDLAESLPASSRKLLRFLDQLAIVDAAGFHPNRGNVSRWGGRSTVATSAAVGFHVSRRRFDDLLREHARDRGARIVNGRVQAIAFSQPLRVDSIGHDDVAESWLANFVLDCSGRAGVVANKGLRRFDAGYRTLALVAEWQVDGWPADEVDHTIIESYVDGWAWSVPLSSTRRQCTVMIDQDRTTISKRSLTAAYRTELAKASGIAERLAAAAPVGHPWACDATLYRAERAFDRRVLLVGDAASFIEPLSSAGVKKALTSAWRAAVVVETCLADSRMLGTACEFFDQREREVYRDCVQRSGAFFREAAPFHEDTFWTTRASAYGDWMPPNRDATFDDPTGDPTIRPVVEQLRRAPDVHFTLAPGVRLEPTAVIEGRHIVMRDGVVIPGDERPLRFAVGVNLPELIHAAVGCRDLSALLEAYRARAGDADPQGVLASLAVLIAKGVLLARYAS